MEFYQVLRLRLEQIKIIDQLLILGEKGRIIVKGISLNTLVNLKIELSLNKNFQKILGKI